MDCVEKTHYASLVYPPTTHKVLYNSLKQSQIPMSVTLFGDEKTVFYLEKVILGLYNFIWG